MHLKNYMEIAVDHIMPNLLKAFPDICVCEMCILDIKAIALNHLKPHYTVTDAGETWSKIEEMRIQFEADIMKALIDAINIVSKSPRHDTSTSVKNEETQQ
ncbi:MULTISPECIES: late competence development ComFB family protein [unclassified Fusibacter]|uniref:late competence development ComFB family protein n=1 Tax=unclassified Fusibacter TaxID=2624464 RepID=UPI0010112305|nr:MULTISPECIES: late competence development ComFB family protein [unclassified Fusibacter]MCK8058892.1 late competence development ComFB family protein [Fusibacter sp. A2]NPE21966.1 late competence development ComFB family protein [Fusibacter sp. A1]RXV61534.1 competence protein ComFB [Fusibacter sp. A1]